MMSTYEVHMDIDMSDPNHYVTVYKFYKDGASEPEFTEYALFEADDKDLELTEKGHKVEWHG